ncbi:MAG: permease prefix domain 1-containing protein [Candidatus Hydrogenedentes bacterium]|nr:permease prefix domain 1-containing protein [Candidatus Hydrogenedentota bacterium]
MPDCPENSPVPPPLPADYLQVNQWVEAATRGLCDEARDRIAADIRRHVCEAMTEYETQGQSPEEALNAAIQQLGDAKNARRGFKRTNLSRFEVS